MAEINRDRLKASQHEDASTVIIETGINFLKKSSFL